MTNFLHTSDKFVVVHDYCSKIPPSASVYFATRVLGSRVVGRVDLRVRSSSILWNVTTAEVKWTQQRIHWFIFKTLEPLSLNKLFNMYLTKHHVMKEQGTWKCLHTLPIPALHGGQR